VEEKSIEEFLHDLPLALSEGEHDSWKVIGYFDCDFAVFIE
jgi:hypothetical protein